MTEQKKQIARHAYAAQAPDLGELPEGAHIYGQHESTGAVIIRIPQWPEGDPLPEGLYENPASAMRPHESDTPSEDVEALVAKAKELGISAAHAGWKVETLLNKIAEAEAAGS